jgi:16S rRNA (cytidine1402-2'-O)-methyltransferase
LYVEERELKAGLYVVPTPIGNIGDMTLRAVEVLKGVDVIAAEDTRHSRTLLNHYEIATSVISFHEHSGESAAMILAERVALGQSIALISDAGTPLVSDPGYQLVRAVQSLDMPVVPLPGPCAAITALSAAGLPTHSFQFVGFLPSKQSGRRTRLEALRSSEATIILYEAPHRILELLDDIEHVLGAAREVCIARELTKTFETVRRDSAAAIREWIRGDRNQQRGEFVVLIAADVRKADGITDEALNLLRSLSSELPPRKAAQIVADHYGLKSRDLYQILISRE